MHPRRGPEADGVRPSNSLVGPTGLVAVLKAGAALVAAAATVGLSVGAGTIHHKNERLGATVTSWTCAH